MSPSFSTDKSVKVMNFQSEITFAERKIEATKEASQAKTWSQTPTSCKVTTKAESLITQQDKLSNNYIIYRDTATSWLVAAKIYCSSHSSGESAVIPRWKHIRRIVFKDGILFCSCKYFERIGTPCRHQICVLKDVLRNDYHGLKHTDISVTWLSETVRCAYAPTDENKELSNSMRRTKAHDDTLGPHLPIDMELHLASFESTGIDDATFHQSNAIESVLQPFYTSEKVAHAVQKYSNKEATLCNIKVSDVIPQVQQTTHMSQDLIQENMDETFHTTVEDILIQEMSIETQPKYPKVLLTTSEYYSRPIPLFKEAVSAMEHHKATNEVLDDFCSLISGFTAKYLGEVNGKLTTKKRSHGTLISSNLPNNKCGRKRQMHSKSL